MIAPAGPPAREIVVGRNSKVWQRLSRDPAVAARMDQAIGHHDLTSFAFTTTDRVWVLSYSRSPSQNAALLQRLNDASVREVIYVSSASSIVATKTRCYEYPSVKHQAEEAALLNPNARILTIGLMHDDPTELPSGTNIATSYKELAEFMVEPCWPDDQSRRKLLFHVERIPFDGAMDDWLFRLYGRLIAATGTMPCMLRPIDLMLRLMGIRWYGYTYLSNRAWTTKTL